MKLSLSLVLFVSGLLLSGSVFADDPIRTHKFFDCAAYLKVAHLQVAATKGTSTVDAVDALTRFRLYTLGINEAEPSNHSLGIINATNSPGKLYAVAERIRGIEKNWWTNGTEKSDGSKMLLLGFAVKGHEAIQEVEAILSLIASVYATVQKVQPSLTSSNFQVFWKAMTAGMFGVHMHSYFTTSNPSISQLGFMAALFAVAVDPVGFAGYHLEPVTRHSMIPFMPTPVDIWQYSTLDFQISKQLVEAITNKKTSVHEFMDEVQKNRNSRMNNQLNSFIVKLALKFLAKDDVRRGIETSMQPTWVGIDRLIVNNPETGEPELTVIVRSSTKKPNFGTSAEKEEEKSPALELAPVRARR